MFLTVSHLYPDLIFGIKAVPTKLKPLAELLSEGKLLSLPYSRPGWKWLGGTNGLAYNNAVLVIAVESVLMSTVFMNMFCFY